MSFPLECRMPYSIPYLSLIFNWILLKNKNTRSTFPFPAPPKSAALSSVSHLALMVKRCLTKFVLFQKRKLLVNHPPTRLHAFKLFNCQRSNNRGKTAAVGRVPRASAQFPAFCRGALCRPAGGTGATPPPSLVGIINGRRNRPQGNGEYRCPEPKCS